MHIEQLSLEQFQNFLERHPLNNYCQTVNYALMMGQYDYSYEFIGLMDNHIVRGASLVLIKRLSFKSYFAYAPKGFLIDYTDSDLVNKFVYLLKDYLKKRHFVFLRINPEIAIGEINPKNWHTTYNNNYQIIQTLTNNEFKNVSVNQDFDETLFPTITGVISLKDFGVETISKNTRNKIRKGLRMGLYSEFGDLRDLKYIKQFMPKIDEFYYEDFFNAFQKNNLIDIVTINIDANQFLLNSQEAYGIELKINTRLSEKMIDNASNRNINSKMNSDKALLTYKNSIIEASKMVNSKQNVCIAGAIIIKDGSRIRIIASGFDRKYKHFVPNYYLYYAILNHYKDKYSFADLNGISNNFNKDSKYYGLNKFKIGYNPKIYELIGEYDLIINPKNYKSLFEDNLLVKVYKTFK